MRTHRRPSSHLAGEMFAMMARINIVHVPYKGAGPALIDLIGGQVQMLFANPAAAYGHVRSGKLRALAVTGDKCLSQLPAFRRLPRLPCRALKQRRGEAYLRRRARSNPWRTD
ncbi:MAG: tripartite tricarboxylate transporter substrate-binding protein [Burkholderiales bacterium]